MSTDYSEVQRVGRREAVNGSPPSYASPEELAEFSAFIDGSFQEEHGADKAIK